MSINKRWKKTNCKFVGGSQDGITKSIPLDDNYVNFMKSVDDYIELYQRTDAKTFTLAATTFEEVMQLSANPKP
jgi:hypothetical protein